MSRLEEVELTNMCMICDGNGNVLVQDKKNHPTWHGWNFPGGHVEKGETEEETALREIMEETGLTVHLDNRYRQVVSYSPRKDVMKDVVYFVAHALSDCDGVAQEGEISQIKWVDIHSAVEYVSFDNDKKILLGAIEHYLNNPIF